MMNIDTSELLQIQELIDKVNQWPEVASRVIDKHMDVIVEEAKGLAPSETGFLRDQIRSLGIKIAGDVVTGEVLSGADYSSFVHQRDPFLSEAVERDINNLTQDLIGALEDLLR